MTASRFFERETLAALLAIIRREQSACTVAPALLVPLAYPHLWWMADGGAREPYLRAVAAAAARQRTLRGPWLRRLDRPADAPSLEMRLTSDHGMVSCLAFAGALLVAGTNDGSLVLWETDSGRAESIAVRDRGVLAMAPAEEGRLRVCTEAGAGELDIADRRYDVLLPFDGLMTAAAFAVTSDLLAVSDALGRIEIWDLAARVRRLLHAGRRIPVVRLGWSPDATLLVAIHSSGLATVIDVAQGEVRTRALTGARITAVLPGSAPRAVRAGRQDGCVIELEDLELSEHRVATLDNECIQSLASLPEAGLAVGCESGLVGWFQNAGGIAEPHGHFRCDQPVDALAIDAARGLIAASHGAECELHALPRLEPPRTGLFAAASRPAVADGLGIVVGGRDGHAHVVRGPEERVTILPGKARFTGPAAAAFGAPVWAAAHRAGDWRAWNVAAAAELGSMGAGGRVAAIDVSPDGTLVITGYDNGWAIAWDSESGAERGRSRLHDGSIQAIALHPGQPALMTAGTDRRVRAWRLRAPAGDAARGDVAAFVVGKARGTLARVRFDPQWEQARSIASKALAFAPDGRVLYCADGARVICLRPDDGGVVGELTVPEADWIDVAVSPDGCSLAAAGGRGGVYVWSLDTGTIAARYELANSVHGLAWSAGRELVVTTSAGELARLAVEGLPPPLPPIARTARWTLERWESNSQGDADGTRR